ncbi:MAG: lipid-A-disaccharide synthase [Gammaproteobacteria bacterium]|nr:lipid-A-disaccharide synthase [Gammaproteobacteria bacterium]
MPAAETSGRGDGRPLRVALVAGESSGDLLGAGLIGALAELRPGSTFEGIGGPLMEAAGCSIHWPAERLAAFGLIDVLAHLPQGLRIRAALARRLLAEPPDVFVGIDAPAFNLGLESRLHRAGIPTVHYVSPTVWAWRRYRLRTLRRAVDLLLTLFPFEADFCNAHGMPATFVGHPLAEAIPTEVDRAAARRALGLDVEGEILAVLPGSRGSEVRLLADPFLEAAAWLAARRPGLRTVVPVAAPRLRPALEQARARHPGLDLHLVDGRAREAMAAADVLLLASGTATLEGLLSRRPMVVAYRVNPLTYLVTRPFFRHGHFAMPNLLCGEAVVPEFLQGAVDPATLGTELLALLDDPARAASQVTRFAAVHDRLRQGADRRAAEAVAELAERRG